MTLSLEARREKYHNDPERREKLKQKALQYYHEHKEEANRRMHIYHIRHRSNETTAKVLFRELPLAW